MTLDDLMKAVRNPALYIYKPLEDGYYYTWNPKNDADRDWDQIFEITNPIQHLSPEEFIEKKEDKNGNYEKKDSSHVQQKKRQKTGYVRPYFRFLSIRIFPMQAYSDDILAIFEEFNGEKSRLDLLDKAHSYRQALTIQIERQAQQVENINRQMADILKVCFHEGIQVILSKTERDEIMEPNYMPDLRFFYRDAIMYGDHLDHIKNYWLPKVILGSDHLPEMLKESSAKSLLNLAEIREPFLKISENIARQLLSLETIIGRLLTGKDFSDFELAIRNMPDPQKVALQFCNNATNPKYGVEVVSRVMQFTRDFIFQKNITQEILNVSEITKEIERRSIVDFADQIPSINTVKNWIKQYADLALGTV